MPTKAPRETHARCKAGLNGNRVSLRWGGKVIVIASLVDVHRARAAFGCDCVRSYRGVRAPSSAAENHRIAAGATGGHDREAAVILGLWRNRRADADVLAGLIDDLAAAQGGRTAARRLLSPE